MLDLEQTIRERAYQLWLENGCQDGHADAHWLAAQREILSVSLGHLGRVCHEEVLNRRRRPESNAPHRIT
jgi:Protein of unknown function (DUF2934)